MSCSIRVLTYNIWLRPPGISESCSGDHKDERMEEFLREQLPKYDILAFQEFFGSWSNRRRRFLDSAYRQGFHYSFCSQAVRSPWSGYGLKLVDGGLLLLSRFPLQRCEELIYSASTYTDSLAQKGVLYARVSLPQGLNLDLFVTHLQANYEGGDHWEIQQAQLRQLRAFIQDRHQPVDAVGLLLGDMNVDALCRPRYRQMMNLLGFPRDLMKECHEITAPDCSQSLDYMFALSEAQLLQVTSIDIDSMATVNCGVPYLQLSDHYGISARLQLRQSTSV